MKNVKQNYQYIGTGYLYSIARTGKIAKRYGNLYSHEIVYGYFYEVDSNGIEKKRRYKCDNRPERIYNLSVWLPEENDAKAADILIEHEKWLLDIAKQQADSCTKNINALIEFKN